MSLSPPPNFRDTWRRLERCLVVTLPVQEREVLLAFGRRGQECGLTSCKAQDSPHRGRSSPNRQSSQVWESGSTGHRPIHLCEDGDIILDPHGPTLQLLSHL